MAAGISKSIADALREARDGLSRNILDSLGGAADDAPENVRARADEFVRRFGALFDRFLASGSVEPLRADVDALCEETAAAGVSLETFARVVRGVYASHKSRLLERMPVDPVELHNFFLRLDEYQNALFDAFSRTRSEYWRRRQRESDRLNAEFFRNVPFPAFMGTPDLTIRDANPSVLQCLSISPETLPGRKLRDVLLDLGLGSRRADALIERLETRGVIAQEELKVVCPRTRDPMYLLLSASFVEDLDGERVRFQAMVQDITRIKWLERQASDQMAQFGAVFYSTPVGLVFLDATRTIQRINDEACRLMNYPSPDQMEGLDISAMREGARHCRAPEAFLALLDAVVADPEGERSGELEMRDPTRLVGYSVSPVHDPDGRPVGWLWILRDVTEEVATENLKKDLTHMLVHDLKNPLTAIRGATFVLRQRAGEDSKAVEAANLLLRNCDRMMNMIMNLLDVERLESGNLDLVVDDIPLRRFLEGIVQTQRLAAGGRSLEGEFDLADDARLAADSNLVERVLLNLIGNAIKHTRPTGRIALRARADGDGFRIDVVDDGAGIPKEFHEKIFHKFGQAELRREGRGTDTGLGLTFCKLAVEAHGGTIGVESEPGKGSTFSVRLPARPVRPDRPIPTARPDPPKRRPDRHETRPIRLDEVFAD